MKLSKLVAAMLITGLSGSVYAGDVPVVLGTTGDRPDLTLAEKGAYALIESMLSTIGGLIAFQGCGSDTDPPRVYTTHVFVEDINGNIVTGFNGNTTGSRVDGTHYVITDQSNGSNKGTLIKIEDDPGSAPHFINNVQIDDFTTRPPWFGFSRKGDMAYASADMTVGGEFYDEHIIKDFWLNCTAGELDTVVDCLKEKEMDRDILDFGLELITKLNFPRTKYEQSSKYHRPNGDDGWMWIVKTQIAPNIGTLCQIRLNLSIDDLTNTTLEGTGTIATNALPTNGLE